jgi:hypothetical protein
MSDIMCYHGLRKPMGLRPNYGPESVRPENPIRLDEYSRRFYEWISRKEGEPPAPPTIHNSATH